MQPSQQLSRLTKMAIAKASASEEQGIVAQCSLLRGISVTLFLRTEYELSSTIGPRAAARFNPSDPR